MSAATYQMSFPGAMLQRGFWLYVWRVETPNGEVLYVGRTGDNSSPNAVAPYTRMGQHLGFAKTQNALRKHLTSRSTRPEDCAFLLISHGPIYAEVEQDAGGRAEWMKSHVPLRNKVGAMERALAVALKSAGYDVLNTVNCRWQLDEVEWLPVRKAFAQHFPGLKGGS